MGCWNPKVATANVHFGRRLTFIAPNRPRLSANDTSAQTIRAVNPVVQTKAQAIDARLIISRVKAGKKLFHHVCAAVAVRVFRVENVRRGANKNAFAPRNAVSAVIFAR